VAEEPIYNAETFARKLMLDKDHQYKRLDNPSRHAVLAAADSISHHILIEGNTSYRSILERKGWKLHQTNWQRDHGWHYVNMDYIATSWDELWGWYSFQSFYTRMAEWIRPRGRVVEIGTHHGRSICHLTTMLKSMNKQPEVFAIDNYGLSYDKESNANDDKIYSFEHPRGYYLKNVQNFKSMGLGEINIIPNKSEAAYSYFEDNSIDFLYIDGSHRYKHVVKDIDAYYPKVRPGGIISGHDYDKDFDGVIRAVDERFGADQVKIHPGTVWSFTKPF
jgi:hypothetical protein